MVPPNTIIAFDTSALIEIYFYSPTTQDEIVQELLPALSESIFIPSYAVEEFMRHKDKKVYAPISKYENLITQNSANKDSGYVEKIKKKIVEIGGLYKALVEQCSDSDKHPIILFEDNTVTEKLNSLINEVGSIELKIQAAIEKLNIETKALVEKSSLVKFIETITLGQNPLSYSQKLKIAQEGHWRYEHNIPPGYKDAEGRNSKSDITKFGDLFIWKELLDYCKETQSNALFITNDAKEDWVAKSSNGILTPRNELVEEFRDYSQGKRLDIFNMSQFLRKVVIEFGAILSKETLSEVEMENNDLKIYNSIIDDYSDQFGKNVISRKFDFRDEKFDSDLDILVELADGSTDVIEVREVRMSSDHLVSRLNKLEDFRSQHGIGEIYLYLVYSGTDRTELEEISLLNDQFDFLSIVLGYLHLDKFKRFVI